MHYDRMLPTWQLFVLELPMHYELIKSLRHRNTHTYVYINK